MFNQSKPIKTIVRLLKWLGKSLGSVSVTILSLLGFVSAIISFIQLFLGNRKTLVLVIIIISSLIWIILLGRLAYISFSMKNKKVGRKQFRVHQFEDHLIARQWLFILFILTGLTISAVTSYTYNKDQELRSKTIILLTNFKGPDPENYLVNEKLFRQLNESMTNLEDVVIKTIENSISEEAGSISAKELGEVHRADLVLWGYYGVTNSDVLITIHIENLNLSNTVPLSASTVNELQAPSLQIHSFQIQQKLANQMTALVYFIAGIVRHQDYKHELAIELFTNALFSPDWAEQVISRAHILNFRAASYREIGEYDYALSDINEAIRLQPESPSFLVRRGQLFHGLGKHIESSQDFNKAILIDPNYYQAYLSRSNLRTKLGQTKDALADLNYAIQLEPENPEAYSDLGWLYFSMGDYTQAIQLATNAIDLDKKNPESYGTRGALYININEYQEAINDFDIAIKLNPSNPLFFNNRGVAYSYIDIDKSCKDYKTAIDLGLRQIFTFNNLAVCYVQKKLYDQAIYEYSRAININAESIDEKFYQSDSYTGRARTYIRINAVKYKKEAIDDLMNALILINDPLIVTGYPDKHEQYKKEINDFLFGLGVSP